MGTAAMPVDHAVDAIVRGLYGAINEGAGFGAALQPMSRAFDAHICALHTEDRYGRSAGLEIFGAVDVPGFVACNREYAARWAGKNLWVERGMPGMLACGYQDGDAVVHARELLASEYYRHFLRPLDIRHGLGVQVSDGVGPVVSLVSINRSAGAGPFSATEMARVGALRPHLANAYAICRRLDRLEGAVATLRASLDRVPFGVLVLDATGRVRDRNAEADRLLDEHREVSMGRDGTLRLAPPAAQARLDAALRRLPGGEMAPLAEAIVLARDTDAPAGPLLLHLCALPDNAVGEGVRVLAFLGELNRAGEDRFAEGVLRAALGLTPMEATVVLSLRENHDPAHVALALGLALSTVRSHLKHAFLKSGTNRQGDLLRLVDRLLVAAPCA
jgi:DNA-binding CsgD family transcriptional regulator/PAS domain-containing protein